MSSSIHSFTHAGNSNITRLPIILPMVCLGFSLDRRREKDGEKEGKEFIFRGYSGI